MICSKPWLVGVASVVAGVGALGAEAAQLCVNPGGTGGCFATVQAAVIAASAGDIIVVAAGTYAEHVTVNKTLTLNGANANVNACTGGRGPESTVSNAQTAFNITANNVTLNGFTIRDNTDPNVFGSGVLLGAGTSGAQVLNNISTNNIVGIQLGSSNSLIQGNAINSNNQPGPISGTGIYSDQFVAGGTLQNPQIIGNCFDNDSNAGVTLASSDLTKPSTNLAISNNVFTNDGSAVAVSAATNATISGNTAHGSSGTQIVLFGGTNGVSVTSNAVLAGAGMGIRLLDAIGGAPNVNVTVSLNRIVGNPTAGLGIDAGGYTGTVQAVNNWWGCNAGPGAAGCDTVVGNASFNPWLVLTLAANPASVPAGSSTTLLASLNTNSNGAMAPGSVPNGTAVAFASTCSPPNPASAGTTAGSANSTVTPGGPGCSASATVDNQTVSVTIRGLVTAAIPALSVTGLIVLGLLLLSVAFLHLRRKAH